MQAAVNTYQQIEGLKKIVIGKGEKAKVSFVFTKEEFAQKASIGVKDRVCFTHLLNQHGAIDEKVRHMTLDVKDCSDICHEEDGSKVLSYISESLGTGSIFDLLNRLSLAMRSSNFSETIHDVAISII